MLKFLVSVFTLTALGPSFAAPQCNVPNPPPVCNGPVDPGDPAPAPLIAAPFVNGGGSQYNLGLYITVTPPYIPPYTQTPQWTGAEIQRSASAQGPWSTWKRWDGSPMPSNDLTLSAAYYFQENYADAPPSGRCVRAKVWLKDKTSAWSEPKCMGLSSLPTLLRLARTNAGVLATWNDTSTTDQSYYVKYWTDFSSNAFIISGSWDVTGSMQALLPGVNGLSRVCVAIYAIEPYPQMWKGGSGGWLPQFIYGSPLARLNNPILGCAFGV